MHSLEVKVNKLNRLFIFVGKFVRFTTSLNSNLKTMYDTLKEFAV